MKVLLIAATTIDGFIAKDRDHAARWTGRADKREFVRITREAGVIVMGMRSFATIGRALPDRRNIVYTNRPESISVPNIETTNENPRVLVERLQKEGTNGVAICGGAQIYNLFISSGLIDELFITVVPRLFGSGISLLDKDVDLKLRLLDRKALEGGSLLLHYSVVK